MGQIANQMLIEWCQKIIQRVKEKEKEKKDGKPTPEKTNSMRQK